MIIIKQVKLIVILINIAKNNNLVLKKLDGMKFNILDNNWKVSNDTSVNYIVKLIRD